MSNKNCDLCGESWESHPVGDCRTAGADSLERTGSAPICYVIEEGLMERIRKALEGGLENTRSALVEHDASLGRTTSKNKWWAETLEQEIAEMERVISELPNNALVPPVNNEHR